MVMIMIKCLILNIVTVDTHFHFFPLLLLSFKIVVIHYASASISACVSIILCTSSMKTNIA